MPLVSSSSKEPMSKASAAFTSPLGGINGGEYYRRRERTERWCSERSSEEEVTESDKEEQHQWSSVLCRFKQRDTVFAFTAVINIFRGYTATVCTRWDPVCCITIRNKIYKCVTICETLMVDTYDNFPHKYPNFSDKSEFCCV